MSTSYGLIIELSRNEKQQEYRIILSQHTIYTDSWTTFDMFTAAMFIFFCEILNMCRPRTTFYLLWWAGPFGLAFYGSGPACLLSRLLMVNAGWLGFIQSEIFLQIKFIIFQGCSTKQAAFLPGQLVTYNQLLIHHFSLFQNAILHKMLKLGF